MIPPELLSTITAGDMRELGQLLPDESIDIIITDPPYPRKYIPLYAELGKLAQRVLKPSGFCIALGAIEFIPEHLAALAEAGLQYFSVFSLDHRGGYPRLWAKHLLSAYKPVYVFTKGDYRKDLPWMATTLGGEKDKRFHEWGQGERPFYKWIDMLTKEGDVVLDPFAGGGTVCCVAKKIGRRPIGFELVPEVAKRANVRLEETPRQLFFLGVPVGPSGVAILNPDWVLRLEQKMQTGE